MGDGMITRGGESFGALVRREREAKEIGLREMAKNIGVSPRAVQFSSREGRVIVMRVCAGLLV